MNHACNFAGMTSIIRPALVTTLVLTSLIACNNTGTETETRNTGSSTISLKEKELRASIDRFPDSIPLRDSLIFYLESLNNIDMALAETNKAIDRDSLNADLLDTKARLYLAKNDTVHAIEAFERAARISPYPGYLMSLGSLYAQTRNPKALTVSDVLIKANGGQTAKEGIFLTGLYHSYSGDKTKAIPYFDQCMAMDYTFMPAYLEKAVAYYDQAKFAEASQVLEKAITIQNTYDEGYYWLGRCYEKLNRPGDAIEQYRTALAYSPDYTEAQEALKRLGAN